MKISRPSQNCLKISVSPGKGEKVDILADPFGDLGRSGVKADILMISEVKEKIAEVKGAPFSIEGPGEYEIKGVFIQGIEAQKNKNESLTIYTIEAENMRICYLGNFGQKELSPEQLERINTIDILIVSVGGTLSSKEIKKIISQIEPKVVIPTQPTSEKSKTKLREFLREMGAKSVEERKQVIFKKKELREERIEIVVLDALKI